jgi:hypothetical protein
MVLLRNSLFALSTMPVKKGFVDFISLRPFAVNKKIALHLSVGQ